MSDQPISIGEAIEIAERHGYVVLKAKSYAAALERQHIAQAMLLYAEQRITDVREWANKAHEEQRRLSDRLTFVYGEARAAGVSHQDLAGPKETAVERPAATGGTSHLPAPPAGLRAAVHRPSGYCGAVR